MLKFLTDAITIDSDTQPYEHGTGSLKNEQGRTKELKKQKLQPPVVM